MYAIKVYEHQGTVAEVVSCHIAADRAAVRKDLSELSEWYSSVVREGTLADADIVREDLSWAIFDSQNRLQYSADANEVDFGSDVVFAVDESGRRAVADEGIDGWRLSYHDGMMPADGVDYFETEADLIFAMTQFEPLNKWRVDYPENL